MKIKYKGNEFEILVMSYSNIFVRQKSLNKKKNPAESQKKQEFMGVRNELYKKYYG